MRRTLAAACALTVASVVIAVPTHAATKRAQSTLCVGGGGCYSTIQAALDAASDGDTVKLNPGTFAGGVTIAKSLKVVGAGSSQTIIKGGGPVVTVFRDSDPAGLTVTIKGITITGGVNQGGAVSSGGGLSIPTSQLPDPPFNGTGATVTVADSVISNNVVRSPVALPAGGFCGPRPCGFDSGGGIDNGGVLTVLNTRVSGNTAGSTASLMSLASAVFAGGINNRFTGTLVLEHSVVSGNHAVVTTPNGQNADTGGINSLGVLMIDDSLVSDNTTEVTAALAADQDWAEAETGGIHISTCCAVAGSATIRNTVVHGNRVTARNTDPAGVSNSFAGGIDVEGQLLLERSVVSGNVVTAISAGDATADGGGLEVDGNATIRDSIVAQNRVVAQAAGGAFAAGGGIANAGTLTVERTQVFGNGASATGSGPFQGTPSAVQGGGIWNSSFDGQSTATLTLTNTTIAQQQAVCSRIVPDPGRRSVHGVPRHHDRNADRGEQSRPVLRLLIPAHRCPDLRQRSGGGPPSGSPAECRKGRQRSKTGPSHLNECPTGQVPPTPRRHHQDLHCQDWCLRRCREHRSEAG